jgi:hypothetical protein
MMFIYFVSNLGMGGGFAVSPIFINVDPYAVLDYASDNDPIGVDPYSVIVPNQAGNPIGLDPDLTVEIE